MSDVPPMTCGELLVHLLEDFGVEMVFGIPGVHTVELYRGLPATAIRHVTPRHEQGAGFMADGYARTTGKPGVCFIITGPGMTNIATAMAQAYADSIPMLVISSVNKVEQLGLGWGRLHELPHQRNLVAGVSAFSHTLMRPDELPLVLSRAFGLFRSARPRPVHLEIPIDVITRAAGHVPRKISALPGPPGPDPAQVQLAADLLGRAERPVLLLGGGAIDAAPEALAIAERLDAPTAYTVNAKGLLPRGHALGLGSNASLPPVRRMLRDADVVLAVGTELGETDYDVLSDGGGRIDGALVRMDIAPEQLHSNFAADVSILSDARLGLRALLAALGPATRSTRAGAARAAAARAELAAAWPAAWQVQARVLEAIRDACPGAIVVGDSTQPVYAGNHLFEADAPRSWFNSATGYGTLGYALPAAIGAQLGSPRRPVIALVGDGGLQFSIAEMASAVEARTPIVLLLWNNHGYGEIKRFMQERQLPTIGVDIYTPDFQQLAQGFGWQCARATGFASLHRLLTGRPKDAPFLLEILEAGEFLAAP